MAKQKFKSDEVVAAIRQGHTPLGASKILKCDSETVRNYIKRYPSVAAAISEEHETMVDLAEHSMRKAVMDGEPWAVSLTLKTLGKDRGYVEKAPEGGERRDITFRIIRDGLQSSAGTKGTEVKNGK